MSSPYSSDGQLLDTQRQQRPAGCTESMTYDVIKAENNDQMKRR